MVLLLALGIVVPWQAAVAEVLLSLKHVDMVIERVVMCFAAAIGTMYCSFVATIK